MRDRKVDEHLVIGVTAAAGRRIGRRSRMRQRVESREHGSRFKPTLREPRGDQRVAKHAREFFAHGRRGEPAQFAAPQRRSQRPAGRVVEHQQVERDIGVQDKVHAPIVTDADRHVGAATRPRRPPHLTRLTNWSGISTAGKR